MNLFKFDVFLGLIKINLIILGLINEDFLVLIIFVKKFRVFYKYFN